MSASWPRTMLLFIAVMFCKTLVEGRHDPAPYLLVSQEKLIWRMNLDGSDARVLVREPKGRVIAVDYHYRLRYMFWINIFTRNINRANLEDGSGGIVIVDARTRSRAEPAGLTVDWMEDKLYWTDQTRQMIEVYNIRTGETRMMMATTSLPYGIAVDPLSGWLYWADRDKQTIERRNITGTEWNQVQSSLIPCTVAITLDQDGDELLWCDLCYFRLERSNTDGSNRRTIAREVYWCYGLAAFQDYVYWTKGAPPGVCRTKKHGKGPREVLATGHNAGRLFGVAVVHPMKQPLPADVYAGECEYHHNCSSINVVSTSAPSVTSSTTLNNILSGQLSSSLLHPTSTFHSSVQIVSTSGELASHGSLTTPSPTLTAVPSMTFKDSVVSADFTSQPFTSFSLSSSSSKLRPSTTITSIHLSTQPPTPSMQSTAPDPASWSAAPSLRFDPTSSSMAGSTTVSSYIMTGSSTAFLISKGTSRHTETATSSTSATDSVHHSAASASISTTSALGRVSKSPPVQELDVPDETGLDIMPVIYGSIGSGAVLLTLLVTMCCLGCVVVARRRYKHAKKSYSMPVRSWLYDPPGEVAEKNIYDTPRHILVIQSSPTDSEASPIPPSDTRQVPHRELPPIRLHVLDILDLVPGANGVAPAKE